MSGLADDADFDDDSEGGKNTPHQISIPSQFPLPRTQNSVKRRTPAMADPLPLFSEEEVTKPEDKADEKSTKAEGEGKWGAALGS